MRVVHLDGHGHVGLGHGLSHRLQYPALAARRLQRPLHRVHVVRGEDARKLGEADLAVSVLVGELDEIFHHGIGDGEVEHARQMRLELRRVDRARVVRVDHPEAARVALEACLDLLLQQFVIMRDQTILLIEVFFAPLGTAQILLHHHRRALLLRALLVLLRLVGTDLML